MASKSCPALKVLVFLALFLIPNASSIATEWVGTEGLWIESTNWSNGSPDGAYEAEINDVNAVARIEDRVVTVNTLINLGTIIVEPTTSDPAGLIVTGEILANTGSYILGSAVSEPVRLANQAMEPHHMYGPFYGGNVQIEGAWNFHGARTLVNQTIDLVYGSTFNALDGLILSGSRLSLAGASLVGLNQVVNGSKFYIYGGPCPSDFVLSEGSEMLVTGTTCSMANMNIHNASLNAHMGGMIFTDSKVSLSHIRVTQGGFRVSGAGSEFMRTLLDQNTTGVITDGELTFENFNTPIQMGWLQGVALYGSTTRFYFDRVQLNFTTSSFTWTEPPAHGISTVETHVHYHSPAPPMSQVTTQDSDFWLYDYLDHPDEFGNTDVYLNYVWRGRTRFHLRRSGFYLYNTNAESTSENAVPVYVDCAVWGTCAAAVYLGPLSVQTHSSELHSVTLHLYGSLLALNDNLNWTGSNASLHLHPYGSASQFELRTADSSYSTGKIDFPVIGDYIRLTGGITMHSFIGTNSEIYASANFIGTSLLSLSNSRMWGAPWSTVYIIRWPQITLRGSIRIESGIEIDSLELLDARSAELIFDFTTDEWADARRPKLMARQNFLQTLPNDGSGQTATEIVIVVSQTMLDIPVTYNHVFFSVAGDVNIPIRVTVEGGTGAALGDCLQIQRTMSSTPETATNFRLTFVYPDLLPLDQRCSIYAPPTDPVAPTDPQTPVGPKKSNNTLIGVAIGVPVAAVVILAIAAIAVGTLSSSKKNQTTDPTSDQHAQTMAAQARADEAAAKKEVEMVERGWQ